MVFTEISKLSKATFNFVKKNRTVIMTGMTVAGVAGTAILSGKSAIKAYQVIEEEEYSRGIPLTPKEKFKKTWKIYIPPFACAVATATLSIGAQALNMRTHTVLLNSYLAEATARKTFEKKAREVVGDKKVDKIRNEVNKDKVALNPPDEKLIISTSSGRSLYLDAWSGRYFYSSPEKVQNAFITINKRILRERYASVNDLYYELELPPITMGDRMGWHIDYDDDILDVNMIDSTITTYGEPCGVLDYSIEPIFDFDKMY